MKKTNIHKLVFAAVLVALAVVGSLVSFPIGASKCAPVQHLVNIIGAVFLGPAWAVGVGFTAALLRNLLGLGSLLAFPGSMVGAFVAGMLYKYIKMSASFSAHQSSVDFLHTLLQDSSLAHQPQQ